jgi:hypothetical protein
MAVGSFLSPTYSDWVKPADWIDISNVGNNEINLLVIDNSVMSFSVGTSSGTYSIDWGDGTIDTGRASATTYQRSYPAGTGTPTSYGYNTIKIRIYGASGNIISFRCQRPTSPSNISAWTYNVPLLWAVFGTNNLTSLASAFGDGSSIYPTLLESVTLPATLSGITGTGFNNTFANAWSLRSIIGLNSPWGNITTMQNMFIGCKNLRVINLPPTLPNTITNMSSTFNGCVSLTTINNFPSTWPTGLTTTGLASCFTDCQSLKNITLPATFNASLTDFSAMFQNCFLLETINFATTWPTASFTCASMFNNCRSLMNITLPTTWANCTNTGNMFAGNWSLMNVSLPATGSNVMATSQNMFITDYSLRNVTNTSALGSPTTGSVLSGVFSSGAGGYLTGSLSFNAMLNSIGVNGGSATTFVNVTGVRLTNTGSMFAGTSPQVNVSYTNMGTGSLVDLFNDLTVVTGKTINITGASGAAGLTAPQRAIATGKGWSITG